MDGVISHHNPQKGMVAVQTKAGYSIFELIDDMEYEIGDIVSWQPDTACGRTEISNVSKNRSKSVYFQNHWVHPNHLRRQLLMD
jgi:hypothetical protein